MSDPHPPTVPGEVVHADAPEPRPPWWRRMRLGYNAACVLVGLPLTGLWSDALHSCATGEGLAGAWVLAIVPLAVAVFADNIWTVAARGAHRDLWIPKIRAALGRVAMWITFLAPAKALPLVTVVYVVTGVRP